MLWPLVLFTVVAYLMGLLIDSILTQQWFGQIGADFINAFITWPSIAVFWVANIIPVPYPKEPVEAFLGAVSWNFAFFQGTVGGIVRIFLTGISGVTLLILIFKIFGRE